MIFKCQGRRATHRHLNHWLKPIIIWPLDPDPGPQHSQNLKRQKTAIPDAKQNSDLNQNGDHDFGSRKFVTFYDDDDVDDIYDDDDDDEDNNGDRQFNVDRPLGVKGSENFFYALPPKNSISNSNSKFRAKKSFVSNFQKSEMDFTQGSKF